MKEPYKRNPMDCVCLREMCFLQRVETQLRETTMFDMAHVSRTDLLQESKVVARQMRRIASEYMRQSAVLDQAIEDENCDIEAALDQKNLLDVILIELNQQIMRAERVRQIVRSKIKKGDI